MKKILEKIRTYLMHPVEDDIEGLKFLQGKQLVCIQNQQAINNIRDAEFKVFSQWGEDGIIQWIISKIPFIPPTFIEFGVEDYRESNTRFLLMHNNWKGLVIDGGNKNIEKIRKSSLFWRHDLTALCSFVTRENINNLFQDNGFRDEIGILSIDIDGNDYWVWDAIETIIPKIVICEYNSIFGPTKKVTIPYKKDFVRSQAHYSYLYYGASLASLVALGRQKGYICVGGNSAGNNVFFVHKSLGSFFEEVSTEVAYIESKFRESRDNNGKLSFLSGEKRLKAIRDMPLLDLDSGDIRSVSEIYGFCPEP